MYVCMSKKYVYMSKINVCISIGSRPGKIGHKKGEHPNNGCFPWYIHKNISSPVPLHLLPEDPLPNLELEWDVS